MFKLIAIDMDGTLLNDYHEVPQEVKDTLVEAKKLGIKIVLCSGRPIVGMREYVKELNLNEAEDYAIAFNGAYIENSNTGEVVNEFSMENKHLLQLYELSFELNTPMHFFDVEQLYTPNQKISKYTILESYLNDIPLNFCPVNEFPKERTIPNIMYINEPSKISKIMEKLPEGLSEEYAIVKSAPHFLEFTHPDATKGNAVKLLATKLGIKQHEIMAIGDNGNDISMIQFAGCGVAMKNAIPEVKAVADYETLTNNEGGVAHAIQKFILDQMKV